MNRGGGGGGGGGYSVAGGDEAVPGAGGGGGGPVVSNPASRGVGYYKAVSVPSPSVDHGGGGGFGGGGSADQFNGAGGAPSYNGASSRDLKRMGKAPKLDDTQDTASAPEAPQAAVVTQSTTQDLSLPDDEFVSRYGLKDTAGKKTAKAVGRKMGQVGNKVMGRAYGLIRF
jgi:hypothetical protein